MKLIHKLSILLLAVTLWSCAEDVPERAASPVASDASIKAYFPNTNKSTYEVGPLENEITIKLFRVKSDAKATVALNFVDKNKLFTAPQTVTFEAGDAEALVTIGFAKLELFKSYNIELSVGMEFTNPYVVNNEGTTNFVINLQQSDWSDYSTGVYASEFFETEWDQIMQYSKILEMYRFRNLWVEGVDYTFKWDGSDKIIPGGKENSGGAYVFGTGYEEGDYGLVTTNTSADSKKTYYDAEDKTFYFYREFVVKAGSFKEFTESYTIESLIK